VIKDLKNENIYIILYKIIWSE